MAKTRLIYLDIIKILAIILVIFNHSHWYIYGGSEVAEIVHECLFFICKIAVPLFIMTTGALMLKRELTYREIFTKRIIRVFVPLIIVTLLCIIIYGGSIKDFIASIFTNHKLIFTPYWLWYLYLLIALYVATPFIKKMISNFEDKDYHIFILFYVFIAGLINMVPLFTNVIFGHPLAINESLQLGFFPMAFGYYIMGYYLSQKEITTKIKNISLIGLLVLIVTGTIIMYIGNSHGLIYDNIMTYSSFMVALLAIFAFVIIKYYFSKSLKSKRVSDFVVTLSNSVFGIYLLHVFFVEFLHSTTFIGHIASYNTFLGVIVLDIIVFVFLTFIIWLLRKIPIVKKFL